MPRIDMHAHPFPAVFQDELERRGAVIWQPTPTIELLRTAMDDYAIDATVVSLPFEVSFRRTGDGAAMARKVNEAYADMVRDAPTRLGALASLPVVDPDAALAELDYALGELGMEGVILNTSYDDLYLGDPSLDWLFEELERREAYVFVHPIVDPEDKLKRFFGPWLLELPFETTRAVTNLIFSGTVDRCPNIKFQFAHMGGTVPFLVPRFAECYARFGQTALDVAPGELDYFKRLYWDTGLSAGIGTIEAVRAVAGIGQILFGTDWMSDTARPKEGGDAMPVLNELGREDRAIVEWDNPARLVPRVAERVSAAVA